MASILGPSDRPLSGVILANGQITSVFGLRGPRSMIGVDLALTEHQHGVVFGLGDQPLSHLRSRNRLSARVLEMPDRPLSQILASATTKHWKLNVFCVEQPDPA